MLVLVVACTVLNAQGILGIWVTIDDETGKEKSHVEIYKKRRYVLWENSSYCESSKTKW